MRDTYSMVGTYSMVDTGGEGEQGRAPLVVLTLWLVQGVRVNMIGPL